MSDTPDVNLPPEVKDALNTVADNAANRLYETLMTEAKDLFWGAPVDEKTQMGVVYLISLRLTNLITKKIKERTL